MNRLYVLESKCSQLARDIGDSSKAEGNSGVCDHGCLDVDLATDPE